MTAVAPPLTEGSTLKPHRRGRAGGTLLVVLLLVAGACGDAAKPAASCPVIGARTPEGSGPVTYSGIASGSNGTCVVASSGRVACWEYEQEGDATLVADVTNARRVVVGPRRLCAIRDGGSVVCWTDLDPPEQISGFCGATELATAQQVMCAVVSSGDVLCQGPGLGAGSAEDVVRIPGVTGATAMASGRNEYMCALIEDGSVVCWGGGPRSGDRPGPEVAPVPEISGAIAIAGSGGFEVCALLADQTVSCWSAFAAPSRVEGLSQVASLSVAPQHGCAVLTDGTVRCWGTNASGELGDGTQTDSDVAVEVQQLEGVQEVSVGTRGLVELGFSCALLADGSAACWGARTQPGPNGDWVASPTPVSMSLP